MTIDELDRIRESFVVAAEEGCASEVAALRTIMKYHGVEKEADAKQLAEWGGADEEGNVYFEGLCRAADKLGMRVEPCFLDVKDLEVLKIPLILFMWNEYYKPVYDVCYGIHEGRFVLWDADWGGPRQYWPSEMELMWIDGIAIRLYPGHELMQKADYHIKWWQLYDWTKWLKRRWDSVVEFVRLEIIPRFR